MKRAGRVLQSNASHALRVWRSYSWARVARKQLGQKETPSSQNHTCVIIYCVAMLYSEIRDTELDRQACQHDHKVALARLVIPLEDYIKYASQFV